MIEKIKEKVKDLSKNNKKLFLFCIIGVIVLLTIIGGSYAVLQLTLFGEKEAEIVAGTLAIKYADGNIVQLENVYPVSDKEGMKTTPSGFSVENTGNLKVKYDVSLELGSQNGKTLNAKYVKYAFREKEGEWSSPKLLSEGLTLIEGIEIEPKEKREYELKLWVDRNTGNDGQGKEFKGKITVSAVQINAETEDITPPVIIIAGESSINVEEKSSYTDEGVERVEDNKDTIDKSSVKVSYEYYDGESTSNVEQIDTNRKGVYYVYYKVSDQSKNEAVAVRSVNVYKKDTIPPVIRLNGSGLQKIEVDGEYEELGATAIDEEEGDLTSRIVTIGTVNTKRRGLYNIKYLITDQEGNTASIVRIINVGNVPYELTLDIETKPTEKIEIPGVTDKENVSYKSEDENVATVDGEGNVEAKDVGETKVIITDPEGKETEIIIKVEKTIEPTYEEEGPGVIRIENTENKCAISKKGGTCTVPAPGIIVEEGYEVVGWSENPEDKTGVKPGSPLEIGEGKTYYPITYKKGVTYTINFNANGNTIDETSKSCTTGNIYRGEEEKVSCMITTPEITAPSSTPTVIGYNQNTNGTTKELGSGEEVEINASNNGKTYYAITSKLAVSYTATFNKNGATSQTDASGTASTAATVTRVCTIPATYNGGAQATTCNVTSPVIVASSNTPTITGYSTSATRYANDWSVNSSKALSSNVTYYAQTTKAAVTRTVTYSKGSGVSAIGSNSGSCTIAATYNGASQGSSCNVTLPTITSLAGYNTGFWSTSSSATSGTAAGSSVGLSSNVTYYARALDTTKPVWKLGSGSSSGSISTSSQIKIVIQGTDTSGSVTSSLAVGNITVKVGTTTVTPTTKTLSAASNITNGKQYTLTLGGINVGGALSITIAANTLKDGSNNQNIATTITPNVTITKPISDIWNPTNLGDEGDVFDGYIIGENPNNFVKYGNALWRIVSYGSSIKMMRYFSTDTALFGVQSSNTYYFETYCSSDLGKSLNGTFYSDKNFPDKNIIVKNVTWDSSAGVGLDSGSCTVGLLNKYDYDTIVLQNGKYTYYDNVDSWINDDDDIGWIVTRKSYPEQYYVKCYYGSVGRTNCVMSYTSTKTEPYPVHPVVQLYYNVTIASGKGTKDDPYILNAS